MPEKRKRGSSVKSPYTRKGRVLIRVTLQTREDLRAICERHEIRFNMIDYLEWLLAATRKRLEERDDG